MATFERKLHIVASKLLNVPDDDHEFDEQTEPLENVIRAVAQQKVFETLTAIRSSADHGTGEFWESMLDKAIADCEP